MPPEHSYVYDIDRLLAVRPAPGQIQARYYSGFTSYLWKRGENPREILETEGIDPRAIADPDNHLDCTAMANIVDYCGRRLDDPLFGFHLAEHQEPDVFGCVSVLARAAPVFRQAIQVLIDYLPMMHSPEGAVWIAEARDTAEIRWSSRSDLHAMEQPNYYGSFMMLKSFRMLAGEGFKVRYLGLGCTLSLKAQQMLEQTLGCKVIRTDDNLVSFDRDLLDRPISSSNAVLYDFLGGYLSLARRRTQPDLKSQVEAYVRSALPTGWCMIERCAARLGVSVRVLQKRMGEAGLTFWSIMEEQRRRLAIKALLDSDQSLDDIALSLGYSDQTCFGRAFKRWTGTSPRVYRERGSSGGLEYRP